MEAASSEEWARQQWQAVNMGDKRLNRRAVQIGQRIAAHPEASLPQQMAEPADLEAAYRFLNNRAVTMEALLEPDIRQTLNRARNEKVVLWVEDTTELDYTHHRDSKQGMASIGDGKGYGLLLLSTLAVVPNNRRFLGLGHLQVFLRVSRENNKKYEKLARNTTRRSLESLGRSDRQGSRERALGACGRPQSGYL